MDNIVDLLSRSDDELRALITELEIKEREISRQRRILHGQLDILRAELLLRLQRKHSDGSPLSRPTTSLACPASSPASSRRLTLSPRARARRRPEVFCPQCGLKNSEGASYCVRCGASLIADQPEAAITMSFDPRADQGQEASPAAVAGHDACLVIRSGGGRAGETYVLRPPRVTIGRHPDAVIFLDDITVSRHHATVVAEGAGWASSTREASTEPTSTAGATRVTLSDGDEIQIGKYRLTFLAP